MRILKRKTLQDYWKKHPQSETPLSIWFNILDKGNFESPNEIKEVLGKTDFTGNNLAIFNIGGNKYRLIARIRYKPQIVYILFIGTHSEYDKIDINNY